MATVTTTTTVPKSPTTKKAATSPASPKAKGDVWNIADLGKSLTTALLADRLGGDHVAYAAMARAPPSIESFDADDIHRERRQGADNCKGDAAAGLVRDSLPFLNKVPSCYPRCKHMHVHFVSAYPNVHALMYCPTLVSFSHCDGHVNGNRAPELVSMIVHKQCCSRGGNCWPTVSHASLHRAVTIPSLNSLDCTLQSLANDTALQTTHADANSHRKLNTSPTTIDEKDALKKLLTTPPVKKIDLHFPLGLEVTARNLKGVTIKDALDAIHKQFKKKVSFFRSFMHNHQHKRQQRHREEKYSFTDCCSS